MAEPRDEGNLSTTPASQGPQRQAWTFSSSGWLFVYFFGVIKCLRKHKLDKDVYVIGSSGGACAGTYLFLDADIDKTVEYIKICATKARSHWRDAIKIRVYVAGALDNFLPRNINAGKKLEGKFEVSVTGLSNPFKNIRIKSFESNEAVKKSVLASACILPPPVMLDGYGWCMDGCYSDFRIFKALFEGGNFLTMHAEDAIRVCPFYMSRADIKPSRWIPFWWAAYPPGPEKLNDLFHLGFHDTEQWLKQHGHRLKTPKPMYNGAQHEAGQAGSVTETRQASNTQQSMFGQFACQAPSCDESLKEVAVGAWSLFRVLLGYLLWMLICLELSLSSCISFGCLAVSVFRGGDSLKQSRTRFMALLRSSTISSWELLKTIPKYSPQQLVKNGRIARDLSEHSFAYRLFYFVLQ